MSSHTAEDGEPADRPRKRNRPQLSCAECKRRKIKCSRTIPCEPCIKRNEAEYCHLEPNKPLEPPLSGPEQRSLATRLHALETVLFSANPGLRPAFNDALATVDSSPPSQAAHSTPPGGLLAKSETEDAAAVLENLAFNGRHHRQSHTQPEPVASSSSKGSGLYPSIVKVDPVGSSTARDPVTVALHAAILKSIPRLDVVEALVQVYWGELAWNARVVCRPQFEADMKEFYDLLARGEGDQIDPAWLAILFAMMALVIPTAVELGRLPADFLPILAGENCPTTFYRRSCLLFQIAEGSERPQFRCLQALMLYILFLGTVEHDSSGNLPHMGWIVLAFKHAHVMGLYDLGNDPECMPQPDPAFPVRPSSLARQLACRFVWAILFYDVQHSGSRRAISNEYDISTAKPANVNDADLGFDLIVPDNPISVPTDMSFEIAKISVTDVNKKLAELKARKTLDRGEALACTNVLRGALIDFGSTVPPSLQLHALVVSTAINNTIVRMHRPWLQEASSEPAFRSSADICISSALEIICTFDRVTKLLKGPTGRFWLMPIHVLSAVVALMIALYTLPHDTLPVQEINRRIDLAYETLGVHTSSSNVAVRRTAECALRTIATIRARHQSFSATHHDNQIQDASIFLKLVASDLESQPVQVPPVSSSAAPAFPPEQPFDPSRSMTPMSHSLSNVNGFPLSIDPMWIFEDQDANWLSSGLGHF